MTARRRREVDLRIRGFGRFRARVRGGSARDLERRRALVRKLGALGQFGVLEGIRRGVLPWALVEQADREGTLATAGLADALKLGLALGPAIADVLPRMGQSPRTRARYAVALRALERVGFSLEKDPVRALLVEDWPARLAPWEVSPATKNALRAAVSRFLTRYLGDKAHAFRRAVLHEDRWPKLRVARRPRGLSVAAFLAIVERLEAPLRVRVLVLALSGMRVGELLAASAVFDAGAGLVYTAGKTGPRVYAIDPIGHAWAAACFPAVRPLEGRAPVRYRRLWEGFKAAARAVGVGAATLHDLRRLYVTLGTEALGPVAAQRAVGHSSVAVTLDYVGEKNARDVASAVADALLRGDGPHEEARQWR